MQLDGSMGGKPGDTMDKENNVLEEQLLDMKKMRIKIARLEVEAAANLHAEVLDTHGGASDAEDELDEETLEFAGIDPRLRPEAISIDSYVRLANALE